LGILIKDPYVGEEGEKVGDVGEILRFVVK